jgi:hypothetical protein
LFTFGQTRAQMTPLIPGGEEWQAGQVEVSANKILLTKFKQKIGLEGVAPGLGLLWVH